MEQKVEVYKSTHFYADLEHLSFKESNFTFKMARSLVEMLKSGHNISHLIKIEKRGFDKPLYALKTMKDLRFILILEEKFKLTLLRVIRLNQLEEAIDTLDTDEVCTPFEFVFNGFW
jgi:hypothetical protein